MASTSVQLASNFGCTHNVFLSFRGEDTRHNFSDHLYTELMRRGITTFRDDQLSRGEEIQAELLKAIERSRSSIVVFSKTYADSRWCLDELAKIMECKQKYGHIVLPIFYHVDPTDVRNQTGSFGEAFNNHEKNWKNKVERWREALTEVGNISGWHINEGYESKYIKEITTCIFKRLNYKWLYVGENLVGMDSYLRELSLKLKIYSNDNVQIVGIWGVGGIGKTTIAKAIYNQIAHEFDCISFLENVKEIHKDKRLHGLQKQLLYDITGEKHYISNISQGAKVIQNTLQFRKALIVFDDIDDNLKQLEYLVGEHHWFGRGSRVLITTRDKNLLHKVDDLCEIEELNPKDALKLFSLYAFQQNLPKEDYKILLDDVIRYCQGLPLALKVLGSLLRGKRTSEWESELHKLRNKPKAEIQDVLKISYDGLDSIEQAIFLNIACFFKGEDRDFVSKILDGCEMYAESGIGVLKAKCLITFLDNKIYMLDLIQQMGWQIIREQQPNDPSKWSRLWNPDDIYHAFMSKKGMKNVETISLDLSESKEIWFTRVVFAEMKKRFAKMKKLRLLKVYYNDYNSFMRKEYKTSLPEGFEFPRELRYLHWEGLESLPLNFDAENLVAINLKCSNIKRLWKGKKHHEKLKFVDVSDSQQLIQMPKFSSMPNLERLNIGGCTSFRKLHSSIGVLPDMKFLKELCLYKTGIKEVPSSIEYLTSLEILNFSKCWKFQKLPDIFANMRRLRKVYMCGTRIKELPSSMGYLESLEYLDLSYCSNFENFPEIQGNLKCLKHLYLTRTAIKELPDSIGYLESLETISLKYCSKFEKFPEIQGNMKCLSTLDLQNTAIKELPNSISCLEALAMLFVDGCSNLEKFPEIQRNMGSLFDLSISGTAIKELPYSIGNLTRLRYLTLNNCKYLKRLPYSICGFKYLLQFWLDGCPNLDLEGYWEIIEELEHLKDLCLGGMAAITEVPSSIGHLKYLEILTLINCENLVTLPNSIGTLTHLRCLRLDHCPKLHKLPDSLRSLQFCLEALEIVGCNLMEGEIPSDLWCLSSLEHLDVSGNHIRRIPTGIIQLSKLERLHMNHCLMLDEIPKLPSSLSLIEACHCPCLKALSPDPTTDILWSSLLNSKLCAEEIHVVVQGGRTRLIPEWVSDKSMGCEVSIELPKIWYKDDNFLGFALFFHFVHLPPPNRTRYYHPECELSISCDDQSIPVSDLWETLDFDDYFEEEDLEPLGVVSFFPQIDIPNEYRSRRWNYFKARFYCKSYSNTPYRDCDSDSTLYCDYKPFEVKSCGIHLIYAQTHDDHKKISKNDNLPEEDSHSHHKRSRQHVL